MGSKTGISWTDSSWNPIRGCSRVSEGCRHCYAERVAARFSGPGQPYEGLATRRLKVISDDEQRVEARWTGEVRFIAEHLADPLRWKKPRRIFVNSMSDLFHESLSNEQIAAVFGVMAAAPQHTFQVLTKRAKRMREWFEWLEHEAAKAGPGAQVMLCVNCADEEGAIGERIVISPPWPLPNVWLGVSVENQVAADERIPELLATPAAVRFLSCEPLLGPVDLEHVCHHLGGESYETGTCLEGDDGFGLSAARERIDWVIAGCESGPGARPCEADWLRSLRNQCAEAEVAFFLKQAVGCNDGQLWEVGVGGDDINSIDAGPGSKHKAGGVIELPYLDGKQHAAMPGAKP